MQGIMCPTSKCPFFGTNANPCGEGCSHYHFDIELSTKTHAAYVCDLDASDEEYELIEPEPKMSWE